MHYVNMERLWDRLYPQTFPIIAIWRILVHNVLNTPILICKYINERKVTKRKAITDDTNNENISSQG
jgi:hypothetical protein